ncbi:MAG: peptide-methionine (R)-S-oxide reductase [Chloracidobacterium sp.]|nr:peptide-methionine (R)-S-oxide reductase [Chloracidobacterium sp.]
MVKKTDTSHTMTRTEARSSYGCSHFGHLFHDSPLKERGLRYSINSASLLFPLMLETESYGAYHMLFDTQEKV